MTNQAYIKIKITNFQCGDSMSFQGRIRIYHVHTKVIVKLRGHHTKYEDSLRTDSTTHGFNLKMQEKRINKVFYVNISSNKLLA